MEIRFDMLPKSALVVLLVFVNWGSLFAAEPFRLQGNLSLYRFEPHQVYLIEDDIEAPVDKNIELPAGTVFLFLDDKKLKINGNFSAQGSDSAPVVFTSVNDTDYHQNRDSTPALPYSWAGIKIAETASNVLFRNAVIKYADTPMTSRGPGVRLENVRRAKTKLDGFLLNDQKFSFKPNQAFSFPVISPPPPSVARTDSLKKESTPIDSGRMNDSSRRHKRTFRYALGVPGGIAVCIGAALYIDAAVKNSRVKDEIQKSQHYAENKQFPESRAANDAAIANANDRDKSIKTGTVSSIVGALFLCGFGLTFMF